MAVLRTRFPSSDLADPNNIPRLKGNHYARVDLDLELVAVFDVLVSRFFPCTLDLGCALRRKAR
jgi:hypothetical protein